MSVHGLSSCSWPLCCIASPDAPCLCLSCTQFRVIREWTQSAWRGLAASANSNVQKWNFWSGLRAGWGDLPLEKIKSHCPRKDEIRDTGEGIYCSKRMGGNENGSCCTLRTTVIFISFTMYQSLSFMKFLVSSEVSHPSLIVSGTASVEFSFFICKIGWEFE